MSIDTLLNMHKILPNHEECYTNEFFQETFQVEFMPLLSMYCPIRVQVCPINTEQHTKQLSDAETFWECYNIIQPLLTVAINIICNYYYKHLLSSIFVFITELLMRFSFI